MFACVHQTKRRRREGGDETTARGLQRRIRQSGSAWRRVGLSAQNLQLETTIVRAKSGARVEPSIIRPYQTTRAKTVNGLWARCAMPIGRWALSPFTTRLMPSFFLLLAAVGNCKQSQAERDRLRRHAALGRSHHMSSLLPRLSPSSGILHHAVPSPTTGPRVPSAACFPFRRGGEVMRDRGHGRGRSSVPTKVAASARRAVDRGRATNPSPQTAECLAHQPPGYALAGTTIPYETITIQSRRLGSHEHPGQPPRCG